DTFTVGKDPLMDTQLAGAVVLGSVAHTGMLNSIGLMTAEDLVTVQQELKNIYREILEGRLHNEEHMEDAHSQVQMLLTKRVGAAGKKIHSGRSRNDRVLVDLKLYFRSEIHSIFRNTEELFQELIKLSELYKNVLMPGYTHLQIAMPSSFG